MKVKEITVSTLKRVAIEKRGKWETNEIRAEAKADVDPANWRMDYRVLQGQLKEEVSLGMIPKKKESLISRLTGGYHG